MTAIVEAGTEHIESCLDMGRMPTSDRRGMMSFGGTLKTPVMLESIEHHLDPSLKTGDIVVLDGCSVHKAKAVRAAIEAWGPAS